ncbi:carboxylesterase/lipase family protein [Butyrivibrio sp. CB08]|uniref:carboxylesterase/lipase family protein n=1 Tax=Butyrivibrio sp. CB08 TaxID=2364879 RepID=UPI001FAA8B37|nr:carboxylesterase family protein [Butyrivibrio sp. CB08]
MFYFLIILITILYITVLELSKNILISWVIVVLACAAMIFYRTYCKKKYAAKRGSVFGNIHGYGPENRRRDMKFRAFASLFLYIGVLAATYFLTQPPVKRVPVVDNRKPDVTDVISIDQGQLTGVYNEDHTVKAYGGIPYAKAPVGDLRFREPQAPDKWEGVKACNHFGPMAMQPQNPVIYDSLARILGYHDYQIKFGDEYVEEVSEDCLYLNIFAPAKETDDLLPVVIYYHGGSLTTGTPSYSEYRGEDLAKKGVIYVNCAYRLGVFGYYAADDLKQESPNKTTGNYGLLDQIAVLKWVNANIKAFGGDPKRITIAGESAGASSVNALCVSPLTKGLFQYAIAESSSVLPKKPFHTFRSYEDALKAGEAVRSEFRVETSDELRNIPAKELVTTITKHSSMTIDGYAIKEQPYKTYVKGNNNEKALLNGFNVKEADAFMLDEEATRDNYVELLAEDMGDYAEEMAEVVPYDLPARDQHIIIDKLGEAKGALNVAYSAMWFTYPHYVWNNYLVEQGVPAYEYYFTKTNNVLSNYHAGELPYAYGNLWRHRGLYDESDYELSEIMQSYWVNFVYNGDPNGNYRQVDTPGDGIYSTEIDGKALPTWEMRSKSNDKLLQLDTTIQMVEDPNLEIYEVIDKYMDEK